MKKILSAFIAAAMIFCGVSSVFADDPAPAADGGIAVKEGAMLKIDGGRLVLMDGAITVAELNDGLTSPANVVSHSGNAKSDDDLVASGDVVTAGGSSAEVLFYGDVDRDGTVSVSDVIQTLKQIAGHEVDIDNAAADVEPGNGVNTADAVKMLKYTADWAVSLGNIRMVAANEPKNAEFEDSSIDIFFETPLRKIGRSVTESTGKFTYTMKLARNETESVQMFLATDADHTGLSVELSEFKHEFSDAAMTGEILWEYYYDISYAENVLYNIHGDINWYDDYFADPLPPVADKFELVGGRSQGFMINITSDKDTPAGLYRATVDLKNADGQVIKSAYVYAEVWDFTLPDTPYSATAFGMHAPQPDQYPEYYEFMIQNNISPFIMPYSVTDPRAEAIMDDPRVTTFAVGGCDNYGGIFTKTDDELRETYKVLSKNPDWFKKGYIYLEDEPVLSGVYNLKTEYERFRNILGDEYELRTMVPINSDTVIDDVSGLDAIDFIYSNKLLKIWCPHLECFMDNDEFHYDEGLFVPTRVFKQYGSTYDRMTAIRDDPETEFWWYICVGPLFPWPNYFNIHTGLMNRVLMWQQFLYDVEGILYWDVSDWGNVGKYKTQSEGCLIYWKELFGFSEGGPVSSYRMVNIRDSFDDFDYMRMVEEKYDRETALDIVNRVITGYLDIDEDPDNMIATREALAALLVGTD